MLVPAASEELQGRGLKTLHVPFQFLGNKSTAGSTSAAVITVKPCERRLRPTADTLPVHVSWARSASLTPPHPRGVHMKRQPRLSRGLPTPGSGFAQSSPWGPARRVSERARAFAQLPGKRPRKQAEKRSFLGAAAVPEVLAGPPQTWGPGN